jgi:hypothetical protein
MVPLARLLGHNRRTGLARFNERHGGVYVFIAEQLSEPLDSPSLRGSAAGIIEAFDF